LYKIAAALDLTLAELVFNIDSFSAW
jgi:hypothetical protein